MAINLLYLLGVVPDVYRRFSFMLARDIEMFIEHCGLKGLSTKTINSYEQTLRLFMQYINTSALKNLEYLYNSYHALGGNGTGTELYTRAKGLPIKED